MKNEQYKDRGSEILRELRETNVPKGVLAVWYLGQESILVKGQDDIVISIDPYLTSSPFRRFEPPFGPNELTNLSYVFITHDHLDHLDPDSIGPIASVNKNTKYIAPGYCYQQLLDCGVKEEEIIKADTDQWWEDEHIRVKAIPAAHETFEYDSTIGHRYVGYIIELNGVKMYHAGDTLVYPELVNVLKDEQIDLGFLPINGRDFFRNNRNILGNMDVREAAELAVEAGIKTVIPVHYDLFSGNTEWPGRFVDYLYELEPHQKTHILARFERYIYVSQDAF